jgi:hypothetical protein
LRAGPEKLPDLPQGHLAAADDEAGATGEVGEQRVEGHGGRRRWVNGDRIGTISTLKCRKKLAFLLRLLPGGISCDAGRGVDRVL